MAESSRVRVVNNTKFNIGLVGLNGMGYNIRPGVFALMNREDVEYNMAIAPSLFQKPAMLTVEDEELSMDVGIEDVKSATFTDEDIAKVLKGTPAKIKAFIEENREAPHVIEAVLENAKKMDLPVSKMKVLKDAFPVRDLEAEADGE